MISDTDRIRAFLAIHLPKDIRAQVAAICRRLGAVLPGVRFVPESQVHVTLHFFAAISPDERALVEEAAALGASQVRPYKMGLSGVGVFPDARRARVVWLGIAQGAEETARLAALVAKGLLARGLPVEEREFRPHVTLARLRERHTGVPEALSIGRPMEVPAFDVDRLVLFQSRLLPTGPVHTEIASFSLGA